MSDASSEKTDSNNLIEDNSFKEKTNSNEKERRYSINSSKSDSFFANLNTEIKLFIENEADISFSSNSNSELQEPQINIDNLLDSKYWRMNKDLSVENENNNEKDILLKKNSLFLLNENENEKEPTKRFGYKKGYKGEQVMVAEGSNKQSTQSNEDEETRIEPLHNTSDSDSNNSPLNSLSNNESNEIEINCDKLSNEINCDKSSNKEEEKNNLENTLINEKENKLNKETKNIVSSNLLLHGYNFNNDKLQLNDSDFLFPYDTLQNQNKNSYSPFFPNIYINPSLCNFNSNYNLPSPLSSRSIISLNSNSSNKINNNYSQNNEEDFFKKENAMNINGQNNKFINLNINNYNKKLNQNTKDLIDLPLIINQNNTQNIPLKYNQTNEV